MKNMKKLLSAIGLLAVAAPVSLSVVACETNDTSAKERTEALNILSEIIDTAKKVETTDWSLKDRGDFLVEMILGKITFDNKDATVEKIKTVTSQLAWQINKFVDKYDEEASELKQNLSYHLAWATEIYNKAIEVSDIKGKDEFLSIIDKAISLYNDADETKFDEMKDELFQATDKFINENNLTFEALQTNAIKDAFEVSKETEGKANLVNGNLTYAEFFHIVNNDNNKDDNFLGTYLHEPALDYIKDKKKDISQKELNKHNKSIMEWSQENLFLVFVKEVQEGQGQEVVTTFTRDDQDKKLVDLYSEQIQKNSDNDHTSLAVWAEGFGLIQFTFK